MLPRLRAGIRRRFDDDEAVFVDRHLIENT
jgi:hypothetical protein